MSSPTVRPEEPLSLSKWRLEGCFETGLRQAQPLLSTNGLSNIACRFKESRHLVHILDAGGAFDPGRHIDERRPRRCDRRRDIVGIEPARNAPVHRMTMIFEQDRTSVV